MSYYPEVDPNPNFPELEEKVLTYWKENKLFEQSVEQRPATATQSHPAGGDTTLTPTACGDTTLTHPTRGISFDTHPACGGGKGGAGAASAIVGESPPSIPPASGGEATNNEFVFYDGPPFANGLPHYGHLLTGYVKDSIARYQTMKGKRVERRFGWDCHGLPAEMGAEKELGISGRQAIQDFGIKQFNEHCRSSVMKFTGDWEFYVDRQGRWVDFENDYKTMDQNFMESVLWAFKQLWDKDYIYEAYRVMPYSWAAETPLSNFETKLDNSYREREDKAITVAFELDETPKGAPKANKYYVLAWTTTPWTLPSNLALAVGSQMEYVAICNDLPSPDGRAGERSESGGGAEISPPPASAIVCNANSTSAALPLGEGNNACYIISKSALPRYAKELGLDPDTLDSPLRGNDTFSGNDLIGLTYKPLFPYFEGHEGAFRILDGSNFVTDTDGTGIVHMAPGFGEEDQKCCEKNGIELVVPVDGQGRFTDAIFDIGLPPPRGRVDEHSESGGGENHASDIAIYPPTAPFPTEPRKFERDDMLVQRAKDMRKNPTDAERKLWQILQNKRLNECKFRRQEVIGRYIADFVSYEKRLIIELDGSQHMEDKNRHYDEKRTQFFTDQGYTVLRFWNHELLLQSDAVMETIYQAVLPPPDSAAATGLASSALPRGEGNWQADLPPLSLKGLNVIAQVEGKCADEPYTDAQLAKYGLVNLRIINWLKLRGLLIKQEDFKHNYPHCWRTDTPLIYRALPSWYVAVTKFKDRAVELNQQINWIPEHIKEGQMGHMLATAPDWSISRNRFWGTPIPVWKGDKGGIKAFGSVAELQAFFPAPPSDGSAISSPPASGVGKINSPLEGSSTNSHPACGGGKGGAFDLHRPYIDQLTKTDEHGETWTRVEDVFDCWFESGSMPFAQVHYPFENKEWFENHFPADFITEYVGQTRGWFNTLIMLSTALFDKPPFKNCICHGVVLDSETGLKYSKRLKNYKDPKEVMDQFGADALRWLMLASPVMRGHDLAVDPEGKFIRDVVRLAIKPIWNAYNFFGMYANADKIKAIDEKTDSKHLMDRYILAKCNAAVTEIDQALAAYDTPTACTAITQFFEVLNNWYIRRSKERFWKEEKDADKQAAYDTLYHVLATMCKAAAPLLPFTTEYIFTGLTGEESVHLADFPAATPAPVSYTHSAGGDTTLTHPAGDVSYNTHPACGGGKGEADATSAIVGESPPSIPPASGGEVLNNPASDGEGNQDHLLIRQMDTAQAICNAALAIRSKLNIRVRQPLESLTIVSNTPFDLAELAEIIEDEVNVKSIQVSTDLDAKAELKLRVNSKALGKRLPTEMKKVLPASKKGDWKKLDNGHVEVAGVELYPEEFDILLEPNKEFADSALPLSSNDALVILDTNITPELEQEGFARDLVRMIQQARKDAGLHVSDRIHLAISGDSQWMDTVATHKTYITEQTLTQDVVNQIASNDWYKVEQTVDNKPLAIAVKKVA